MLPWSQPIPYCHSDHSGILLVSGCTQIFLRAGVFGHIWNVSVLCTNLQVAAFHLLQGACSEKMQIIPATVYQGIMVISSMNLI